MEGASVLPPFTAADDAEGARRRTPDTYTLTPAEITAYKRDGYLRLPGFLTDAEVGAIEGAYDKIMRGEVAVPGKDFCDMSQPFGVPFEQWRLVNAMLPREYYPALQHNVLERRALSVARQLLGEDMALDYDQLLQKQPSKDGAQNGAVFAWHQDQAYWPQVSPGDSRTATISLALNDADTENGCLRVVPGSHTEPTLRCHRPLIQSREDAHALTVDLQEGDRVLYLPLRRGDVTVHDERIVHGSDGNTSTTRTRKTYVVAFRSEATIQAERALGFNHSHNSEVNWERWIDHAPQPQPSKPNVASAAAATAAP